MNVLYQLGSISEILSLNLNDNLIKAIAFFGSILVIFIGCGLIFFSKYSNSKVAKRIKESTQIKMIISLIIGLAAWFISWTPLKILFFIVSIIMLFSIFTVKRKISTFKIILTTFLVLMIIIIVMGIPFYAYKNITTNIKRIPLNNLIYSGELSLELDNDKNRYFPDSEMSLEYISDISLNVDAGIDLEFTNDDILEYPSRLIVKDDDGSLTISESDSQINDTYVIKIGTATPRKIDINCTGIEISGSGKVDDFSLNSMGTSINSEILSENNIYINSMGLDFEGKMEGKILDINSTGTNIDGELNFEKIQLDSMGVNIEISSQFNSMDINCMGIDGTIKILNLKTQNAVLNINGAGALTIESKYNAPVEIESSGFIKIDRK